jgi:hypothetical protein
MCQYEGQATVLEPPNTETFDPVKQEVSLQPTCQPPATHTSSGGSEITLMLSMVMALIGNHGIQVLTTPNTPCHTTTVKSLSLPIMTPSKLH